MGSWVTGVVLLVAGLGWIVLRVTIEKKATTGSWWSHLIRELAVIQRLPVIGLIWRLLPLLLVAAGILWLSGVRPPGMGDGAEAPSSLCGSASHPPEGVSESAWTEYRCRGQSEAGDSWGECLRRSQYTTEARRGCPGAQRCCPPP